MSSVESSGENLVIVRDKVALRASNLPPGEAVDKDIGAWSLLSKAQAAPLVQQMGAQAKGEPMLVIQNTESGELGISDGTLLLFPHDMTDKKAIAFEYGLEIVKEFKHINMIQVRPVNIGDALLIVETLNEDGRIEAAELNTNFGRHEEF
tara:strand:+ start:2078 stop:2527 length:450 start_codon:yes stop_codon:yes gene_type:complete